MLKRGSVTILWENNVIIIQDCRIAYVGSSSVGDKVLPLHQRLVTTSENAAETAPAATAGVNSIGAVTVAVSAPGNILYVVFEHKINCRFLS